jgi:hypothetical protein
MDWATAKWSQLTWTDWEVIEDTLRKTFVARTERDPELSPEQKAREKNYIRDRVYLFDDVYSFARWHPNGIYVAAALSSGASLEEVRTEFPSPSVLLTFLSEVDIFGVKLERTSRKNAVSAEMKTTTGPTGEQSEPSSPTSSPALAQ